LEGLFEKQDEMRGHMFEVDLNTLDPKSFDNIQDFFTQFKYLLLSLGECGIDKSTQEKEEVFSSLSPCSRPPILMGDDTPIAVAGEGRVELHNGSFENVLHVPKFSMNLLSVYQITRKGKKVEFTSDSISVIDIHDNSSIAIGEVDHKSTLYKFTNFSDDDSYILLTHKESILHAPLVQHAYTLVLPSVSEIRYDSIHSDYVHGNKQVV
jgi:hypothetical protein